MKQKFYCKKCKKDFEIELDETYHNYKCPVHHIICKKSNYTGMMFKGLDTVKR